MQARIPATSMETISGGKVTNESHPSYRSRVTMNPSAITLAALLLAAPAAAAAQSHPLVGKWAIEYAGGTRIENDEVTHFMLKGTLTIAAQGDSLVGTLEIIPAEGMHAGSASRLAARRTDGPVGFETKGQVRFNENGEMSTREIVVTWKLNASGDVLDGTATRRVAGMDGLPGGEPQPVKGTRVKG